MLLAEVDNNKHAQWVREQERIHVENYYKCNYLKTRLNTIALIQDSFHSEHDINGNSYIAYTNDNIIYLPFCSPVKTIHIVVEKTEICYNDVPITYIPALVGKKNQVIRDGFLTENNFIKESSFEVDCKLIQSTQILPSNKQTLVRRGKNSSIFDISHVILHDITEISHTNQEFNLNHHSEIINNYQPTQQITEFQTNEKNDAAGKFYSLPNDEHVSEMQFKSKTSATIEDINQKIVDYFGTSKILSSILGFISSILFAYIIYKIIIIIITKYAEQKAQPLALTRTIEIVSPTAQPTLLEYELAKTKVLEEYSARHTQTIYPVLTDKNIIEPTTEQQ